VQLGAGHTIEPGCQRAARTPAAQRSAQGTAHRTLIFATSATRRVDSAQALFPATFARAPARQKEFLRRKAPPCQPRAAEKILSTALQRLILRAKMRAGGAPSRPALKAARLEDDTGTSLDHLPQVRHL